MSKVLLDLDDFAVTERGDVLFKYDAVVDLFRRGQSVEHIIALDHDDIRFTNQRHPAKKIKTAKITGDPEAPPAECYKFRLPEPYLSIDLGEYLANKLVEQNLYLNDTYLQRVGLELEMISERGMEDFIRTLIYIMDVFEENDVVHGIGRGSSCCSLVLYLIGVHLVDPIKYDLEITEFLR